MVEKIQISGFIEESVVDGTGIRLVVFVQGCVHRCNGCHNPHTHPLDGGKTTDINDIIEMCKKNPLLSGVTLSGGEPFLFARQLSVLCQRLKAQGLNIWCYSGFTLEELKELSKEKANTDILPNQESKDIFALLNEIDVLVDGQYEENNKPYPLVFRGSVNQRIINLKEMRAKNTQDIILYEV